MHPDDIKMLNQMSSFIGKIIEKRRWLTVDRVNLSGLGKLCSGGGIICYKRKEMCVEGATRMSTARFAY